MDVFEQDRIAWKELRGAWEVFAKIAEERKVSLYPYRLTQKVRLHKKLSDAVENRKSKKSEPLR